MEETDTKENDQFSLGVCFAKEKYIWDKSMYKNNLNLLKFKSLFKLKEKLIMVWFASQELCNFL